jgi:hypothetical protein
VHKFADGVQRDKRPQRGQAPPHRRVCPTEGRRRDELRPVSLHSASKNSGLITWPPGEQHGHPGDLANGSERQQQRRQAVDPFDELDLEAVSEVGP